MADNAPPGQGLYGPQGQGWQRINIHCYTQNMEVLGLVVSEKILFYVSHVPIVSLWQLSVAMETRVLIRLGIRTTTTFPHPNDTSDKI